MAGPWLGRWEGGKDSPDNGPGPRHYNVATSPYRRPGMATQTKTPNTPGQAGFLSPQKHKQSRNYSILSLKDSSERNRPGCLSLKSYSFCCFFVFFFFIFHRNPSQQHYHLRYFIERKQWSPKNKSHPLAGRAGSRIWETSLHQ